MNKNSRNRRKLAIKYAKKGNNPSSFVITKTMPGSSLGSRTQVITIGYQPRKSTHAKVGAKRGSSLVKNDDWHLKFMPEGYPQEDDEDSDD